MRDPVIDVANALAAHGSRVSRSGREFKAQCPAHEDRNASMQLGYGERGAILKCHAGCTTEAIVAALGIDMESLFTEPLHRDAPGLKDPVPGAEITYFYEDENGKVLFRVERRADKRFVQARPDPSEYGKWIYALGSTRRVPYRLPNVIGAIRDDDTVWLVEGEKDVHRLEREGLVASCNPGGAEKFLTDYAEHFTGARVVVVPDNDEVGFRHAERVIEVLSPVVRTLTLLRLPGADRKGYDVSDWLDDKRMFGWPAGYAGVMPRNGETLRMLAAQTAPLIENKPAIFNAYDLMAEHYEDVKMAVNGIVAEGVTLLAGPPKVGKSWLALGLGLAVAEGGMALSTIKVDEGRVLYLALEDTPRRLQRRLAVMLGDRPAPKLLDMTCEWPRFNAGGLDRLESWLKANPDARMVIIDTLGKVKSTISESQSMYDADYGAMTAVKHIADRHGTAVVFIHHLRKQQDSDPLNMVLGSNGLTGAVDAICVLTRPRGADEGHLYVTGRDVEESTSIVSFEPETGRWVYLGPAERVEETRMEDKVVELIESSEEPVTNQEVVKLLDMKDGTAKWLLAKLAQEGRIARQSRGRYVPIGKAPTNVPAVIPAIPGIGGPSLASGVVSSADVDEWDAALARLRAEGEFGGDDD